MQKTKIMASDPMTSLQIEGGNVEVVTDFIFLSSDITQMVTAAMKLEDDCSLVGKLCSVLKSKDITLLTKVRIVKAVFSSSHV